MSDAYLCSHFNTNVWIYGIACACVGERASGCLFNLCPRLCNMYGAEAESPAAIVPRNQISRNDGRSQVRNNKTYSNKTSQGILIIIRPPGLIVLLFKNTTISV